MNEGLAAELLAMAAADQDLAARCLAAADADPTLQGRFIFETPREKWPPVYAEAEHQCALHSARLLTLLDAHGWPGTGLVGDAGAAAAWLLTQHGTVILQRRALPLLEAAVQQGQADLEHLAMVTDRLALQEDRAQPYGTHLRMTASGGREPIGPELPPEERDAQRAAVGLDSWADYVTRISS